MAIQGQNPTNPFASAGMQSVQAPPAGSFTNLFKDRKQANIFQTVSAALQLRRENERAALQDRLAEKAAAVQEKQLEYQGMTLQNLLDKTKFDREEALFGRGKTQAEIDKLKAEADVAKQEAGALGSGVSGDSGSFPPGTKKTIKIGNTTYSFDLNPSATVDETNILSAEKTVDNVLPDIMKKIESGILMGTDRSGTVRSFLEQSAVSGGGDMSRFMLQKFGQDGEKLVALKSDLNALQTNYFALAGKALTKPEKEVVGGLLSMVGKSDQQRIADLARFGQLFKAKADVIRKGVVNSQTGEGAESFDSVINAYRNTLQSDYGKDYLNNVSQPATDSGGIPKVGETFNGEKITKVTLVKKGSK